MAERIRFHLDEHLNPKTARALQDYGVAFTTTVEASLRTSLDDAQLEYVRRQERVLVTNDTDFLRIASRDRNHPGIVFCDRRRHTLGDIIQALILVYEVITPEEMVGRVEYI